MPDLFKEVIPSILRTKKEVITAEEEKAYNPYLVNRTLSYHLDTALWANEMNFRPFLDKKMQYDYLMASVRGRSRPFVNWPKKESPEAFEAIKEYFDFSDTKAKAALNILEEDQIKQIIKNTEKGGA